MSIREILENIRDNQMKTNTYNFLCSASDFNDATHRSHSINASRGCRPYFCSDKFIDVSMDRLPLNIPFFNISYTKSLGSRLYKTLIGVVTTCLRGIQKLEFDLLFIIR